MLDLVLSEFGIDNSKISVSPIYQGLINSTWRVGANGEMYVVQKINQNVFRHPERIANNISSIADYLAKHHPEYFFVAPLKTREDRSIIEKDGNGFFRVFPFIKNSFTKDVVNTPAEAFEAARQFGRFTAMLRDFDALRLYPTIPGFHDLSSRFRQFIEAAENGNRDRIAETTAFINVLKSQSFIVDEFEEIKRNKDFKLRVTHHDTKISNVLFDEHDKGICVIDLDTVMPGYFISDLGDMLRTYLSPVSEEEQDMSKIEVRKDVYEAIIKGYLGEMGEILTTTEKKYFFYAGTFMIYMQALRFLTDYLKDDCYYGADYPGHNLNRAMNQFVLLRELLNQQRELEKLVREM